MSGHTGATGDGWTFDEALFDDVDAMTPWVAAPPTTWGALAEEQTRAGGGVATTTTVPKRKRGRTVESGENGAANEEEAKRIRRVKNRASVEKCRTKQRQRLDRLNKERAALTGENALLRGTADQVRGAMQQILEQVAGLSGVGCRVTL